eukprot:jgi/Mesvir1/8616/Mv04947-RA.2
MPRLRNVGAGMERSAHKVGRVMGRMVGRKGRKKKKDKLYKERREPQEDPGVQAEGRREEDIETTKAKPRAPPRRFYINNAEANLEMKFCNNRLKSSKYSIITFLPVNLFEQFCRIANLYFLLIAILQLIPGLSPTSFITSVGPLVFVLCVNAIKEAVEDFKRHRSDNDVNNRLASVIVGGQVTKKKWMKLAVGDMVFVEQDQPFPADMVIISSNTSDGVCYVETSSLDGETNLKQKVAKAETCKLMSEAAVSTLAGEVLCEGPSNRLYSYEGSMSLSHHKEQIPLGIDQLLVRGSTLKNTKWVYGVVVYTGRDTKIVMNMMPAPTKRSGLEKRMNTITASMFLAVFVLCFACAVVGEMQRQTEFSDHPYVRHEFKGVGGVCLRTLSFIILFNQFIPISLYVTLEMVKLLQCFYLYMDKAIEYQPPGAPAPIATRPRTSNLNEELGQISFILSDKTGTLTANEMELDRLSVGNIMYGGHGPAEGQVPIKGGALVYDPSFTSTLRADTQQGRDVREMLLALAICHTVIPQPDEKTGKINFLASSPDEEALVIGANIAGFEFVDRNQGKVTVKVKLPALPGTDGASRPEETVVVQVLQTLEFSSDRKRMSVIVRESSGRLRIITKGADSVIMKRLHPSTPADKVQTINDHLRQFSKLGLRTLLVSQAQLEEEEYAAWREKYHAASVALTNREELLEEQANKIEMRLHPIGITAVNDKLQDGVPDALVSLLKAGIKIWVLTGDKQETAISIGRSCNLIQNHQRLLVINATSLGDTMKAIEEKLADAEANKGKWDSCLVIDGESLHYALDEHVQPFFFKLAKDCRSLICCRVSPLQKALITKMVKELSGAITLGIGDGANDVGMIREAHVGVGVSGREGMQAVMASDYSIAQFRFLVRLLLVHGRWSYGRNKAVVYYSFYKNVVYNLPQVYFAFVNGFSNQQLYSDALITTYNLLWTALPIIGLGVLDQDISPKWLLANAALYRDTQVDKAFWTGFIRWMFLAVWHSWAVFVMPTMVMATTSEPGGTELGIWSLGLTVYTIVVIVVILRVAIVSHYFTWINQFFIIGSMVAWFIAFIALSLAYVYAGLVPEMHNEAAHLLLSPAFWLVLFLSIFICMAADLVVAHVMRMWMPSASDVVSEREHGWSEGVKYNKKRRVLANTGFNLHLSKRNVLEGLASMGMVDPLQRDRDSDAGKAYAQMSAAPAPVIQYVVAPPAATPAPTRAKSMASVGTQADPVDEALVCPTASASTSMTLPSATAVSGSVSRSVATLIAQDVDAVAVANPTQTKAKGSAVGVSSKGVIVGVGVNDRDVDGDLEAGAHAGRNGATTAAAQGHAAAGGAATAGGGRAGGRDREAMEQEDSDEGPLPVHNVFAEQERKEEAERAAMREEIAARMAALEASIANDSDNDNDSDDDSDDDDDSGGEDEVEPGEVSQSYGRRELGGKVVASSSSVGGPSTHEGSSRPGGYGPVPLMGKDLSVKGGLASKESREEKAGVDNGAKGAMGGGGFGPVSSQRSAQGRPINGEGRPRADSDANSEDREASVTRRSDEAGEEGERSSRRGSKPGVTTVVAPISASKPSKQYGATKGDNSAATKGDKRGAAAPEDVVLEKGAGRGEAASRRAPAEAEADPSAALYRVPGERPGGGRLSTGRMAQDRSGGDDGGGAPSPTKPPAGTTSTTPAMSARARAAAKAQAIREGAGITTTARPAAASSASSSPAPMTGGGGGAAGGGVAGAGIGASGATRIRAASTTTRPRVPQLGVRRPTLPEGMDDPDDHGHGQDPGGAAHEGGGLGRGGADPRLGSGEDEDPAARAPLKGAWIQNPLTVDAHERWDSEPEEGGKEEKGKARGVPAAASLRDGGVGRNAPVVAPRIKRISTFDRASTLPKKPIDSSPHSGEESEEDPLT